MAKAQLPDHFHWKTLQGKKYLFEDYRNMSEPDVIPGIKAGTEFFHKHNTPDLLVIMDVTGIHDNQEIRKEFLASAKEVKPYVKKLAVVGLTTLQVFVVKGINKFTGIGATPFKTMDEGLSWLFEK